MLLIDYGLIALAGGLLLGAARGWARERIERAVYLHRARRTYGRQSPAYAMVRLRPTGWYRVFR